MNSNNYNIININPYSLAGRLGINYPTIVQYKNTNPNAISDIQYIDEYIVGNAGDKQGYLKGGAFGLPMLTRYAILSYEEIDTDEKTELLLDTLVISVSKAKNIVKNFVQGVKGSVKEFVNEEDYAIEISGSFTGDPYRYDDDSIFKFVKLMEVSEEIEIKTSFLNDYYKIKNIVITDHKLFQSADWSNMVFFTITALSDTEDNKIMNQKL